MKEDWEQVVFNTLEYRDSGVSILSALDEIQTILDDQIVKTQTMRGSPFIKPFEEEAKVRLVPDVVKKLTESGFDFFDFHEISWKHCRKNE